MIKVIIKSGLFLLLFFTATDLLAQQKATYTVKQGDTLYGISKTLDVTIAELQEWNDLSGNEIELGQELVYYISQKNSSDPELPEENGQPLVNQSPQAQNVFYTVKSGDTLYQIARDHDMTIDQLKELNNLTSNTLRIGQQLAVKKGAEAPPSVSRFVEESSPQGVFTVYEIRQGETATELLERFKMTQEEFKKLNPELNIDRLATGQEVTVLLPPSQNYDNPFLQKANLQDLGRVPVFTYQSSESGETTTNGELYDPQALTAAHSNISLGSIIFIENPENSKGVYVRINDRITNSGLKLSEKAFKILELSNSPQPAVTIYTETND